MKRGVEQPRGSARKERQVLRVAGAERTYGCSYYYDRQRRGTSSPPMNEAHFREIERALLYISEARERAQRAADALTKDGAELHLVAALQRSAGDLARLHRELMQGTYWAVPGDQARLAV